MNKKYIGIFVSVILFIGIVWGASIFLHNQKIKRQLLQEQKQNKEITNKLDNLEVKPVINIDNSTNSGVQNSGAVSSDNQKTTQDIMNEEEVQMLTFSNIRQCKNLKYYKKECEDKFLFSLATQNNNIAYCEKLTGIQEKIDCKDEIYYNQNSCSNIFNGFLQKKCNYNLQLTQKNNAQEEILKKALNTNNTDSNLCKSLTSYSDKESCIKNVVLQKKDLTLCNSVFTTSEEQLKCKNNVSYELNRAIIKEAFEKKDLSLCDKLSTQELKTQCKSMKF